ncbi:TIGR04222 domain-containing membrane protein [Actinophytocola sp. NPDC049390]|uniref:TIGR04222 domain-containing membrane protein n=1 Tax=Actinophytocola sp. NPDC049390 TaxID=3363894 RepID=UPI0037B1CA98
MGMHPWGLSGPEFLWLYSAALVAGVAFAIWRRMAVRRPRSAEPPGPLAAEELGFLSGGPQRAVEVAVARLVDAGAVRVDRRGNLSDASERRRTGHPLDDAVLGTLTSPRTLRAVTARTTTASALTAIGDSLVRRGLLVAPSRAIRARRLGQVVLYVLLAVGVVRCANGIANHLPVGYLIGLLIVTLIAISMLTIRTIAPPKARTVHGDRVVTELMRGGTNDPLEEVAVRGMSAYPDKEVAKALVVTAVAAGAVWSYSSAGSFNSFHHAASGSSTAGYSCSASSPSSSCSSSSSSCGSSCGGGGCGGGSS